MSPKQYVWRYEDKPFPLIPTCPKKRSIAPGEKWAFGSELDIANEVRLQLHQKEKVIFVWGRAGYADIFGKPQHIDFRYQNIGVISILNEKGLPQFAGWAVFPEVNGNDAT
jgi:hypothetical protein